MSKPMSEQIRDAADAALAAGYGVRCEPAAQELVVAGRWEDARVLDLAVRAKEGRWALTARGRVADVLGALTVIAPHLEGITP